MYYCYYVLWVKCIFTGIPPTGRYIEVFRSSQSEVRPFKGGRPTPYMRPGDGGYMGGGSFGRGGDKYGSGYERSYRGGGRGRGSGRGRGYGYEGGGGGGDGGIYYIIN